ncbi:MAG: type II secretion system minor pseudopilin GspJ [Gammaproteobacteria bacterium]|nr:type II secretion system minor pseudopilin GspJ [Gammaproteobacteria bacterium]
MSIPSIKVRRQSGFTLLELLVAIGIFALMAAMAYGGLNNLIESRQITDQHAARLTQLQTTFLWLGRDIEQTVNRRIRDEYGDSQLALSSTEVGRYQLELTRGGWRNPVGRARSNLQRVAYSVRENQLIRFYWNVLDRAQDSKPLEVVLLDGVERMELRFLSATVAGQNQGQQQWVDDWPGNALGVQPSENPPLAVEVTLETEAEGRISRLFRVPG